MQTVKLFTRNGDQVHQADIPDFAIAPEGLAWGSRIFFRAASSTNHYFEGMLFPIFDVAAIKPAEVPPVFAVAEEQKPAPFNPEMQTNNQPHKPPPLEPQMRKEGETSKRR